MRPLFIKIFLWFGVAMIVGNVAAFVTGIALQRRSQGQRNNPLAQSFGILAQTAIDTLEKENSQALNSYLERVENTSHIHAAVLNAQGEEVSGRAVPAEAIELAQRAAKNPGFIFDFPSQRQQPIGGQGIVGPSGAHYVVVAEFPSPDFPRPPRPGQPGSFYFGLGMMARTFLPLLLIGALFCYWLAGYLSKPIVQLRGVTRGLSDGNLGARVDARLLKRKDEIGYLGRDFNLMAGRIESLVEAQRRLLTDISHELRSPLARHGVALGLARKRGGPEVSTALDRIGLEAERINEMIGQVLTLSQLESGTDGFGKLRIDLVTLVKEVVDDADFEARSRGCTVRLLQDEPCVVTGVPQLLRSAVENVVRNAVRYTAPGTAVDVLLHRETVGDKRYAVITVRDHGSGVPEDKIEAIFRPFYRVEDARDRKTGGTGLGLAIAARAVRVHEGSINATNSSDGGLIVEIRIPSGADQVEDQDSESSLQPFA
ncbi:MAG: two-component system, OmpR family, sensor histidine kinase CpxA [Acidobacteriaceae bacterium]|nr:two-component system, OmpR family, sensor histidine kinase CpxA [Acidobacteriaceae bacterium]